MRRFAILVGILLFTASAQAETARPVLKAAATVTGDTVDIGDLVEHAGAFADVAIFRAPDLGTTGAVTTSAVREALRPYGLGDLDTRDLTETVVTRPSRAITVKEIERCILQALAGQHGLGPTGDLKLNIDQSLHTIHIEASATAALQVTHLNIDRYRSHFAVVLDVSDSALLRRTPLRLSGRVIETAETAVLTRSLQRGDVIRASDFAIERRPRIEIGSDNIGRADQATGLAARRALRVGHVLRHPDLMKPELVHRNDTVTLVYEVPGIVLTMRGSASEAGAEGEVVNVLNLQSKRTVRGTVTGFGRVVVTGMVAGASPTTTATLPPTRVARQSE